MNQLFLIFFGILLSVGGVFLPRSLEGGSANPDVRLYDLRLPLGASALARRTQFILRIETENQIYQWRLHRINPNDNSTGIANAFDYPYRAVYMEPGDVRNIAAAVIFGQRFPLRKQIPFLVLDVAHLGARDWNEVESLLKQQTINFDPAELFRTMKSSTQYMLPEPLTFREKVKVAAIASAGTLGLAAFGGLCESALSLLIY